MQLSRAKKRPDQSHIEQALIYMLRLDTALMLECVAKKGFKPIWEKRTRTHAVLSKVAELEGEVGYNPTQIAIAQALMRVDKQFKYLVSGDESRATIGQVRKLNLYRDDARRLHFQWVKIKRGLDRKAHRVMWKS